MGRLGWGCGCLIWIAFPLVGKPRAWCVLHADVEGRRESNHRPRGTVWRDPPSRLSRLHPDVVRRGCRDRKLDRVIDRVYRYVCCLCLSNPKRREDASRREC